MDINRDGAFIFPAGKGGSGRDNGSGGNNGLGGMSSPGKKTSTRKYICPKCGNSFRATKDINVMCLDCFADFIKVEK